MSEEAEVELTEQQEPKFIHLRLHSEYSLCEGAIKIKALPKLAKKHNMPAVAITDTYNLYGGLPFSLEASKNGIQPIIGCDIKIDVIFDKEAGRMRSNINREKDLVRLPLLAASDKGHECLMKIISKSQIDQKEVLGVSPHTTYDFLKEGWTEGLIALSGGVKGPIGELLLRGQREKADEMTQQLKELFPNNCFYMELMRHGLPDEKKLEQDFIDLAYKYDIPLVATNDVYFATPDMYEAQDVLMCIKASRYISETNRRKLTPEHYFKSQEEMIELFKDIPEAIENTVKIAKRCHTMAYTNPPTLPHFHLPEGVTEKEQMRKESYEGLEERLQVKFKNEDIPLEKQDEVRKEYLERLEYEMGIIEQMDFPGYFLIVSDFIIWSKKHDIPVGPGRGSGAGSVVAWAMKITDIDSIRFSLFFERFLNPERVSMPDFDIDFCQSGRGDVIKYVQEEYGEDMVAQIITFGKLQAKAVLKDVGRVLQMGYSEVDKICKMIPFSSGETITLEMAIDMDESLQQARDSDPRIAKLIDIALKLEGLNRHSSTHAAGVVIGHKRLDQICPLDLDPRSDMPAVCYSMKYAEATGLVKFDFLGLKTLTTIKRAVNLIKGSQGDIIDINQIRIDDTPTYKMLSEGDSIGVFQIESSGMRSILRQIRPDTIEDLIALISLYRPGPMDNIPTYIRRKHGEETVQYPHEKIAHILKETYGIIVYQEQVMEIAKVLAGYSLGGADMLRRAMGKKIKEEMDRQRGIFIEGCKEHNNIGEAKATEIFDLLQKFASYGFNKAHAAAYAMISYQTAYLKKHYPAEFYAATMNMDIHDSDKINFFRQAVVDQGIKILPPDVNKSEAYFSVELIDADPSVTDEEKANAKVKKYELKSGKEIAIRFGLGAVKAVGLGMMEELVKEREANGEFKDIFDYAERLDSKLINKKALEALSKCGAFDNIHKNRKQIHDSCDILSRYSNTIDEQNNSNQMMLFGAESGTEMSKPVLVSTEDWVGEERLNKEFEAFGFFLGNHPLDDHIEELTERSVTFSKEIEPDIEDNSRIRLAGVVADTKMRSGPKGRYAYLYTSDPYGMMEIAVFNSDMIMEKRELLETGQQIIVECTIRKDDGGTRILAKDLIKMKDFIRHTKPGDLQKVVKLKARKNFDKSKTDWKKKKEESAPDPLIEQKRREAEERARAIYKELVIAIQNTRPIPVLSRILEKARLELDGAKHKTQIYIDITENGTTQRIDLGNSYCIGSIERDRMERMLGSSVNIEYKLD